MQPVITRASAEVDALELTEREHLIADRVLREVRARLRFLLDVGLDYLSLARGTSTLSGGEAQRIRLASQIGSGLVGVLYVLDEPSIGLHQRDNRRLLDTLVRLRDLGNTVIVVEHDEETIRAADHVVDIGPGRGRARRPGGLHRHRARSAQGQGVGDGAVIWRGSGPSLSPRSDARDRATSWWSAGRASTTSGAWTWPSRSAAWWR